MAEGGLPAAAHGRAAAGKPKVAAQTQAADQRFVAALVLPLEVVEQATARADHHQQAAPAVKVLRVDLLVFGEVVDPLGEQRDLHFRAAGIARAGCVFLNQRRTALRSDRHHLSPGES
jgi:hypothetical protein